MRNELLGDWRNGVYRNGSRRASPSRLWQALHALIALLPVSHAATAAGADHGWNIDAVALASQPDPAPAPLPPAPKSPVDVLRTARLVFDATLLTGIGWTTVSHEDAALADFVSGGIELSLGVGRFAGSHVKIGYELSAGTRRVLGAGDLHAAPDTPALGGPVEGNTWSFLPVGGYLAIYPWTQTGISLGVHLGIGVFWPARYLDPDAYGGAAEAALDLGYEQVCSDSLAWGLHLRYGASGFQISHTDNSDENLFGNVTTNTQNSNELTWAAGVTWF